MKNRMKVRVQMGALKQTTLSWMMMNTSLKIISTIIIMKSLLMGVNIMMIVRVR
jgi:hypothetical protein